MKFAAGLPVARIALLIACCTGLQPARAQRAADNAVTSASDAFGVAVGNEKIGLYGVDDVRGFNPVEAGNARIEGLYFDQQDRPSNRSIEGATIRVGITAQGFAFPAPTGIVDYRLRATRGRRAVSLDLERAPFGGNSISGEVFVPLAGARLGLVASAAARRFVQPQGGQTHIKAYAALLRWRPAPGSEVTALYSGFDGRGEDAIPVLFPAGGALPPRIRRGQFLGQTWSRRVGGTHLGALVAKFGLGPWRIETGVFDSVKYSDTIYADLLRGVRPDGVAASRTIIADADNRDNSLSGELRVSRDLSAGVLSHRLMVSLRGRRKDRAFGGQVALPLGPSTVLTPDPRTRPAFTAGPNSADTVRQATLGLGYTLGWRGHGSAAFSLSKNFYRKRVQAADPAVAPLVSESRPITYSANGSLNLSPKLAVYGGYVRGLEESLIAPDIATNRNEAPPAILTSQAELGLRLTLPAHLTMVVGGFMVKKPFFGLDPALRFGALGTVVNRGVEVSLTGRPLPGLTVVAGSVFLGPKISGSAVQQGLIGPRPVGSVTRRSILNLDWMPAGQVRWSLDTAIESLSARVGNIANTLVAPSRATVAIGARYRTKLGPSDVLVRAQVTNLMGEYGWLVSTSGGFTYSPGRTFLLQLGFDL